MKELMFHTNVDLSEPSPKEPSFQSRLVSPSLVISCLVVTTLGKETQRPDRTRVAFDGYKAPIVPCMKNKREEMKQQKKTLPANIVRDSQLERVTWPVPHLARCAGSWQDTTTTPFLYQSLCMFSCRVEQ